MKNKKAKVVKSRTSKLQKLRTSGVVEIAGIKFYTIRKIARDFGVNPATLLRRVRERKLRAKLMGRRYYIAEDDLRAFLTTPTIVRSREPKDKKEKGIDGQDYTA